LFGEPFKRSDGWVTTLGALAGIAFVVGFGHRGARHRRRGVGERRIPPRPP